MVKLAIETSGGSELTYHLRKPMISIGASSQNDVVVRAPGVAPRHLVVQLNGDMFTFLAQDRQVVVLNGERRSRGVLKVGDRIRMGTATLVFKGVDEGEIEELAQQQAAELASAANGAQGSQAASAKVTESRRSVSSASKVRSEVVLFHEPRRIAEARHKMVELFRASLRRDPVPALRAFFEQFFGDRQMMLAWLDEECQFQPIVSQWTGEVPRVPARTFDELGMQGRFALLRLGGRQLLIYPVEPGGVRPPTFLVLEVAGEVDDEEETILAELARMLAVHWDRMEDSTSLSGPWESSARDKVEEALPGTSHAIGLLRDHVIEVARGSAPVLLSGAAGSGRAAVASLLASIHPNGALHVTRFQGRGAETDLLRRELFGSTVGAVDDSAGDGAIHHARGGMLLIENVEELPLVVQRELAAAMRHDVEAAYGPKVRWVATTREDALSLLHEGTLDATLFGLFQTHLVRVPSFADRREDLPLLVVRLLDQLSREQDKQLQGIELESLNSLLNHPLQGGMPELVAELRKMVTATPNGEMVRGRVGADRRDEESEVAASAAGEPPTLASDLVSNDDLKEVIPSVERAIIDRVLRRVKGNQSKAARILNISRGALIAKSKEYDIPDYRYLRRNR
jgi:DNA-binding NtrC family response regulator